MGRIREEPGFPQRQTGQRSGVRLLFTHSSPLPFELLIGHFSRTVAEAWITLQVAYRNDMEIRVDYKTAQLEGESCLEQPFLYSESGVP